MKNLLILGLLGTCFSTLALAHPQMRVSCFGRSVSINARTGQTQVDTLSNMDFVGVDLMPSPSAKKSKVIGGVTFSVNPIGVSSTGSQLEFVELDLAVLLEGKPLAAVTGSLNQKARTLSTKITPNALLANGDKVTKIQLDCYTRD